LDSIYNFVKNYIQTTNLFDPTKDKLLLAVSGGIDSMVLLDLCHRLNCTVIVAHCNYQLRGIESDEDEAFVSNFCKQKSIPFFVKKFDTQSLQKEQKKGIQVLARTLRYEWFEQLVESQKCTYILTGHHINDAIETSLYNQSKGCGVRGLRGILPKQNKRIRPLLCLSKTDIKAYAEQYKITHREDKSNQSLKYNRNRIRHEIVPVLKEINPGLETTFLHNFNRFREFEAIYKQRIATLKASVLRQKGTHYFIDIQTTIQCEAPFSLLHELLNPLGFNPAQTTQILAQAQQQSGARYESNSHELLKDRNDWIVRPKIQEQPRLHTSFEKFTLPNGALQTAYGQLSWTLQKDWPVLENNPTQIYIDAAKLKGPFVLRRWNATDKFQPLGMQGKQKEVRKLLKDLKFDSFQKENVQVLCDHKNRIIWVAGIRADQRFFVDTTTQNILKITYTATD
jgi:tRNA(Ile)-lysidine synthase